MELNLKEEFKNKHNNTKLEDLNEFLRLLDKNIKSYSRAASDITRDMALERIENFSNKFYQESKTNSIDTEDFKKIELWFSFEKKNTKDTFLKGILDKELDKLKNFFVVNK